MGSISILFTRQNNALKINLANIKDRIGKQMVDDAIWLLANLSGTAAFPFVTTRMDRILIFWVPYESAFSKSKWFPDITRKFATYDDFKPPLDQDRMRKAG